MRYKPSARVNQKAVLNVIKSMDLQFDGNATFIQLNDFYIPSHFIKIPDLKSTSLGQAKCNQYP